MPVSEKASTRKRVSGLFGTAPAETMEAFPPKSRVLLMLSCYSRIDPPDLDGGWYRLTTGRAAAFLLGDKDSRSRALAALEAEGQIEVLRETREVAAHSLLGSTGCEVPGDDLSITEVQASAEEGASLWLNICIIGTWFTGTIIWTSTNSYVVIKRISGDFLNVQRAGFAEELLHHGIVVIVQLPMSMPISSRRNADAGDLIFWIFCFF